MTVSATLLLGGCAFYVTPKPTTSVRVRPVPSSPDIVVSEPEVTVAEVAEVSSFAPDRGAASVYSLGETISFQLQTTSSGYVTVTSYDPAGTASVLAQNLYVAGGSVTLPTPESRVTYTLAPPRGLQRVTLTFSGASGGYALDTAETTFYIQ